MLYRGKTRFSDKTASGARFHILSTYAYDIKILGTPTTVSANFKLMRLNAKTGSEVQLLEYTPGLAICGCNFADSTADSELKNDLTRVAFHITPLYRESPGYSRAILK